MAENVMTKQEYEALLVAWGERARLQMAQIVQGGTHGTGTLAKKLKVRVGESRKTSSHFVGFKFQRYGVFVAYGVGRGWIRQGNVVVRGSRVKKGSELEAQLRSKGYSKKDIRDYVVGGSGGEGRKPVDWFDSVLMQHVDELGNIAAEYYGDYGMERLLEMVNRMTIRKKMP